MVERDLIVIEETAVAGKYRQRRIGLTERWMRDEVIEPRHHAASVQYALDFGAAQPDGIDDSAAILNRWERVVPPVPTSRFVWHYSGTRAKRKGRINS